MIIFEAGAWDDAQNHRPQIERFVMADKIVVIEEESDYKLKTLPQEVRDTIAAREAPPVPSAPVSISRTAALLTLDDFKLSADYSKWAADPARTFRERVFLDAQTWRRNDPVLIAAADALGVTGQLDAMFMHAAATYDKGE